MKGLNTFLYCLITILLVSCITTKSLKPRETKTVWIGSTTTMESVAHPNAGSYLFECYTWSEDDKLSYDKEMTGVVITEFTPFCGMLEGFEYKEGFFKKVRIEKLETKISEIDSVTDESRWRVLEAIEMKKDITVGETEKFSYWIGPEMREVPCGNPMAPQGCKEMRHIYQPGPFYRGGAWQPLYENISIEDFEEGYVYKVNFTKRYNPEMIQVMDGDNYQIEDFEIVSKEKF